MRDISDYKYDVFLSWTGGDRQLKNRIATKLKEKGLEVYDSDEECKGEFRKDYTMALQSSKTYLLILSNNLRNNPNITGKGWFSEVKSEVNLAKEYEALGELNIVILNLTEFFRFNKPYRDVNDEVGYYYYVNTRGYSREDAEFVDGEVSDKTVDKVVRHLNNLVTARNNGKPEFSYKPAVNVLTESVPKDSSFFGRKKQLKDIYKAFADGAQIVVLSGMGGIGKSKLAEKFVCEYANLHDKDSSFRFLQVVRIQDLAENSGLKLVVSSVTYTSDFNESLISVSEREKYEMRLNALRELPEYTILILDNFNSLSENAIQELLRNINCRLLITKRAQLEEHLLNKKDFKTKVKQVYVPEMDFDDAYKMFLSESGSKVEKEKFRSVFVHVGGHTITLCIIAKIMRTQKKSVDEILLEMSEMDNMTEKVDFAHNAFQDQGSDDKLTMMEHLLKLYKMSRLEEGAKSILKNMALLSDGKIPVDDLCRIMGNTQDRNDLLSLLSHGWLTETKSFGRECVILHPVLSQLVNAILKPVTEDCLGMINYLCDIAQSLRQDITYSGARQMESKLFIALYTLAVNEGKLNGELWLAFTELSHLMGELDDLKVKSEKIKKYLSDERERELVNSYFSMVLLEQRPTDIDILDMYVSKLRENAQDYKWVLRAISVSVNHILHYPYYINQIMHILNTAMAEAQRRNDDLGVMNLCGLMMVLKNKIPRNVSDYVKRRKKDGVNNGYLLKTEQYLFAGKYYLKGNSYKDSLQNAINEFTFAEKHPVRLLMKKMVSNPVGYIKTVAFYLGFEKRIKSLDDSDLMKLPLLYERNVAEALIYDDKLDAQSLFNSVMEIYRINYENNMSLLSGRQVVESFFSFMKIFPASMTENIKLIASKNFDDTDAFEISTGKVAEIYVSCYINEELGDRIAVEQSRQLVKVEKMWRSPEHYAVVNALIHHGQTCAKFGLYDEAAEVYREAYTILKENTSNSQMLSNLCMDIMKLPNAWQLDLVWLSDVCETAKGIYGVKGEYYVIYGQFVSDLCNALTNFLNDKKVLKPNFKDLQTAIAEHIPDVVKKIVSEEYYNCPEEQRSVENLNNALRNKIYPEECNFSVSEEMLQRWSQEQLINEISRRIAYAYSLKISKVTIETKGQVDYNLIAVNEFVRIISKNVIRFLGRNITEELFSEELYTILIYRLMKGSVVKITPGQKISEAKVEKKPVVPANDKDQVLKLAVERLKLLMQKKEQAREASKEVLQEVAETKEILPEDEIIPIPDFKGNSANVDTLIHYYCSLAELYPIVSHNFISLSREFKLFGKDWSNAIANRLSDFCIVHNRFLSSKAMKDAYEPLNKLYEEYLDCLDFLRKKGYSNLKPKANIMYYFYRAFIERNDNQKEILYRQALGKCIKKHLIFSNHHSYVAAEIIRINCIKTYSESNINHLLDGVFGKGGVYRRLAQTATDAVLASYDDKSPQTERLIISQIKNIGTELEKERFKIDDHEYRKIKSLNE